MNYQQQQYFKYYGHKYYEGTIVEFNDTGYPKAKYGEYTGKGGLFVAMVSPTERFENNNCLFVFDNLTSRNRKIVRIVKAIENQNKVEMVKVYNDTGCSDMFYAWIAYIVAMIFFSITYNRIIWWIIITSIFYSYRKRKLYVSKRSKENGGI